MSLDVVLDVPDEHARAVIEECVAEMWRTHENRGETGPYEPDYAADIEARLGVMYRGR